MNWYRKAKLIDKDASPDSVINLQCMYCKRWATHPTLDNPPVEEYVWKDSDVLDSGEQDELVFIRQEYAKGLAAKSGVSHGICPSCKQAVEIIGHGGDPDKIVDLSRREFM